MIISVFKFFLLDKYLFTLQRYFYKRNMINKIRYKSVLYSITQSGRIYVLSFFHREVLIKIVEFNKDLNYSESPI